MGAPDGEWGRARYSEDPVRVTLTRPFSILRHEVTVREWQQHLPSTPLVSSEFLTACAEPTCPVSGVTWAEAAAFANLLSNASGFPECYVLADCARDLGEGMLCASVSITATSPYDCRGYRLPTEAEWEYAARAGTTTMFYTGEVDPTSDFFSCFDVDALDDAAWYCANSDARTHQVGQKRANAWGLLDVLGNVAEHVNDPYESTGYGDPVQQDFWALVPGRTGEYVVRGGNAVLPVRGVRVNDRWSHPGDAPREGMGFRLARTL